MYDISQWWGTASLRTSLVDTTNHKTLSTSWRVIMAEWRSSKSTSSPGSASDMTSLARALSHTNLNEYDPSGVFQPQTSVHRGNVTMPGRRRKLSSRTSSVDLSDLKSPKTPSAEARVLVINTGGTIGMTLHNKGMAFWHRFSGYYFLVWRRWWSDEGYCISSHSLLYHMSTES